MACILIATPRVLSVEAGGRPAKEVKTSKKKMVRFILTVDVPDHMVNAFGQNWAIKRLTEFLKEAGIEYLEEAIEDREEDEED